MKVIRVLTYEGDAEWLERQLSDSLPDGVKEVGDHSITVRTVVDERPSQTDELDTIVVEAVNRASV